MSSYTTVKIYVTNLTPQSNHIDILVQCDDKIYIFNNDTYCITDGKITKSYDGVTSITPTFLLTNIVDGDDVTINSKCDYENSYIGKDKRIINTDITLQGNDSQNYNLICNYNTPNKLYLFGDITI